ncbi:hypothetical protein IV49_GL002080 [Kandleria vitulina DSM 20405]|uniref:4Fe-4S ferredoxin-type domain-containing protein n=1 Tax=Kandleria vitulina DSM 20405 TaxID=1410657 RepID=A0A0R2HBM6_9FIRM|nr:Coenzyme F420 hydrogenase/dehydrogenase, beta subunit C-terminal domain [Kandleria vitulina]KRN50432.1 hypothetical protein IV49_GL002080 [Kandleria vitulina DSM 20405]
MNKNTVEKIEKNYCSGCGLCSNICPKGAIIMKDDEEGFLYPTIDKSKCINCGMCYYKCPINKEEQSNNKNISYACYSKDDYLRNNSSSGGIFGVIAKNVLKEHGVVFGAAFDEKMSIKHIYIESESELIKILGSKYVQSSIGNSYKDVKHFLSLNKKVLFSGTPCQVRGLKYFLGKEYDNLITIDIICHGVPSPKIWSKYLDFRENKDKEKPSIISFRNKDNGWNKFNIIFKYKSHNYIMDHNKDIYMQSFLLNSCLRNSCYNCKSKGDKRKSDITLGDFWGIDKIDPKMNDGKGVSLLIINTDKGQEYFDRISNDIIKIHVSYEHAIKDNVALISSVKKPISRKHFIKEADNYDFDDLFEKYGYILPLYKKIILRLLNKLK